MILKRNTPSDYNQLFVEVDTRIRDALQKDTQKLNQATIECVEWEKHLEWANSSFTNCHSEDFRYDSFASMFTIAKKKQAFWTETKHELEESVAKLKALSVKSVEAKRNLEVGEKSAFLIEKLNNAESQHLKPISEKEMEFLRQMVSYLQGYDEIRRDATKSLALSGN